MIPSTPASQAGSISSTLSIPLMKNGLFQRSRIRATLYGLCAYGADGVHCAIETLRGEMLNELGQYGIPSLKALTRDLLVRTDQLPL
jgi:hypothetical protein